MRQLIALALLAFAAALGVVVGNKMSSEAMAVVVGVVCGVLAGIPTSVILMLAFRRFSGQRQAEQPGQGQPAHYPPVIVVGGAGQLGPAQQQSHPQHRLPRWVDDDGTEYEREPRWEGFKIVGDEGFDDDPPPRRQPPTPEAQWREADTRVSTAPAHGAMTFREANPELYGNGADAGATLDLRDDNELVGDWLDAWCDTLASTYTNVSDLHDSYCEWILAETNFADVVDIETFGRILTGMGVPKRRLASGAQYRIVIDV